ncbi:MAG TPA: M48 family metallopeptidase [Burkholderiales bacterium]|nr:M48 family metallopeptidase [Burkholderiales bacterium]
MNFFEHQEAARRNTRVLVLLYALAVAAVVAAVTAVAAFAWLYTRGVQEAQTVPPELLWGAALGTLGVILLVSLAQTLRLGAGGEKVAEMAGARPVPPETRDPLERRLLNVVEEMAIAAGTRVPKAYVLPGESAINAFAAGTDVSNAVVAVTRGTLESLTRDELQGVIGHEFSHILHGDMRLNLRLMGVLAGIVFIGAIGQFVMRGAGRSGGRREGAAAVLAAGLALFVIGYTGLFFARLIKSAVARQREFLADASSVQYTRNPEGIAGALDQIRASGRGTRIGNRYAEDMSHMYFGESVRQRLQGLFATHPPIEERIRRVHPSFEAPQYRSRRGAVLAASEDDTRRRKAAEGLLATAVIAAQAGADLVGKLDADKVAHAQRLIDGLPASVREALERPEGARAAVLGLLDPASATARQPRAEHLPLVDLALPALKLLDPAGRAEFVGQFEAAARADARVSLREYVLLTLLRDQLLPRAPAATDAHLSSLRAQSALFLSLIARAGRAEPAPAFRAGAGRIGLAEGELAGLEALTPEALDAALEALRTLAPLEKARLVNAMFAAAGVDGAIQVAEAELLRLAGAVLDCPLPARLG